MSRTVLTRVIDGVQYRIARRLGGYYSIEGKYESRWMTSSLVYVYLEGAKAQLEEMAK